MRHRPLAVVAHCDLMVGQSDPELFEDLAVFVGLAMLAGAASFVTGVPSPVVSVAEPVTALTSGAVATLDSPIFTFSPGWEVTAEGADPPATAVMLKDLKDLVRKGGKGRSLPLEKVKLLEDAFAG